eukprot:GFUD01037291.1.p1 GENE.GFUD01037291.1~~GFUD01037291.1.p1  ORF type:complete len:422 (-),score=59.72 GFUD01037291.1:46-1311(-)
MIKRTLTLKMLRGISYTAKIRLRQWIWILWAMKKKLFGLVFTFLFLARVCLFFWFVSLPPEGASLLCSFGKGRLGNQMSSLATMYSFSRKYGMRPFVTEDQFHQLNYYFESEKLGLSLIEKDLPQYHVNILGFKISRIWWELPWNSIDNVASNFNYSEIAKPHFHKGKAIDIGNYPNEIRFYKDFLPELKEKFTLKERFVEKAERKLRDELLKRKIVSSNVTWVGIHNRRGDYGQHLKALYNLSLLSADYFNRAMKYFSSHFSNVIFVVVTDDMEWAESNLNFPGMQVAFIGHNIVLQKDIKNPLATGEDIGDDLALLAACNHTILSYGTFGQWAAFLAGGEVIISTTAAHTKEGREIREGGFGWTETERRMVGKRWIWISGTDKEDKDENIESKVSDLKMNSLKNMLFLVFCQFWISGFY